MVGDRRRRDMHRIDDLVQRDGHRATGGGGCGEHDFVGGRGDRCDCGVLVGMPVPVTVWPSRAWRQWPGRRRHRRRSVRGDGCRDDERLPFDADACPRAAAAADAPSDHADVPAVRTTADIDAGADVAAVVFVDGADDADVPPAADSKVRCQVLDVHLVAVLLVIVVPHPGRRCRVLCRRPGNMHPSTMNVPPPPSTPGPRPDRFPECPDRST